MDVVFSCDDASVGSLIAVKNKNGKWELYTLSKLIGMGNGEFKNRFSNDEYNELRDYTSFNGRSFVAVRSGKVWGLIEIKRVAGIGNKIPPADEMGRTVQWEKKLGEVDPSTFESLPTICSRIIK
jgi:hypothetical protein